MPEQPPSEALTTLLADASDGSTDARERLWQRVYPTFREMAHREIRRGRPGKTFQTTALVHEAYLKLFDQSQVGWKDRVHFYSVAATAMRHVLIDYTRAQNRQKRGGSQTSVTLDEEGLAADILSEELLDLDEALDRLSEFDPRAARVVECRFYGGLTVEETADVLDIASATVKRDWALARAWLLRELRG